MRESTIPLKMMRQKDELDAKGHCGILFLENLLNLDGQPSILNELHIYIQECKELPKMIS